MHLTKQVIKISGKRFFCVTYKQTYIQGFLSSRLGRKYKALQGIAIEDFDVLCLSPSQKKMESISGNAFSSVPEGHNFKFFSPLSAHREFLNMLPTVCPKNLWDDTTRGQENMDFYQWVRGKHSWITTQKQPPEVFLKSSQYSQENTCVGVSF